MLWKPEPMARMVWCVHCVCFDLHHAADARDVQRAAEIVEVVHSERTVFGSELDIVVLSALARSARPRSASREDVRAQRRLAAIELLAQQVATHGDSPFLNSCRSLGDPPPDSDFRR